MPYSTHPVGTRTIGGSTGQVRGFEPPAAFQPVTVRHKTGSGFVVAEVRRFQAAPTTPQMVHGRLRHKAIIT